MRAYEAPELFVDEYVADTMIASSGAPLISMPGGGPKNNNADNNQNCWGCNNTYGSVEDGRSACYYTPNDEFGGAAYDAFCR